MRPFGEGVHDAFGFRDKGIAAGDHMRGFQVALDAAARLHIGRRPFGRHAIINRNAIGANCGMRPDIPLTRAARKCDDWGIGMLCL